MIRLFLSLILLVPWVSQAQGVGEAASLAWDGRPLALQLPTGYEREIAFPERVRVEPPAILSGVLETTILGPRVFWRAQDTFGETRVVVRGESGRVYLFDVTGASRAPVSPVQITLGAARPTAGGSPVGVPLTAGAFAPPASPPRAAYHQLVRLAARALYAPERLRVELPGVRREAVARIAMPLLPEEPLTATPLAAWTDGTRHITAVRLANESDVAIELDPRRVRGRWLAAAFQHSRLQSAGQPWATSTLYLISDRPFAEALPPSIRAKRPRLLKRKVN